VSSVDRDRVLRYPDLAARLCKPPINFDRPTQWTGYVPPAFYGQQINVSPRRDVLVDLIEEARRRDAETAAHQQTDSTDAHKGAS